MKKKLNRKLQLNKSTIAKLSDESMGMVNGGEETQPNCIRPTIINCATDGCVPQTYNCFPTRRSCITCACP